MVEGVIGRDTAASVRDRLNEQVAAEEQLEHRLPAGVGIRIGFTVGSRVESGSGAVSMRSAS